MKDSFIFSPKRQWCKTICFAVVSFFSIVFLFGCATMPTKTELVVSSKAPPLHKDFRIAILNFKYEYIKPHSAIGEVEIPLNAGELTAKIFEKSLLKTGQFQIIDREHLKAILNEQSMSLSGLSADVKSLGRLLNAEGIIVGEITELSTRSAKGIVNYKGTCILNFNLINVQSGEVILSFHGEETIPLGTYLDALHKVSAEFVSQLNQH
jgi:curli biogenesis system outer membrane secretion channel CsgG